MTLKVLLLSGGLLSALLIGLAVVTVYFDDTSYMSVKDPNEGDSKYGKHINMINNVCLDRGSRVWTITSIHSNSKLT